MNEMTPEEKVKLAVKKLDLRRLFLGRYPYHVDFDRFVGPVAPTDWTQIMPYVYKYASITEFERALFDLTTSGYEGEYVAASLIYYHITHNKQKFTGFPINKPIEFPINMSLILQSFQKNLAAAKQGLINSKEWAGANNKLGLYGEILRYDKILKDKYNFNLIEEIK